MGMCHFELEEWKEAKRDFTRSIESNPRNFKAFNRRALARIQLGDFAGARDDTTHVINHCADRVVVAHAYQARGRAYFNDDAPTRGAEDVRRASNILYEVYGWFFQMMEPRELRLLGCIAVLLLTMIVLLKISLPPPS